MARKLDTAHVFALRGYARAVRMEATKERWQVQRIKKIIYACALFEIACLFVCLFVWFLHAVVSCHKPDNPWRKLPAPDRELLDNGARVAASRGRAANAMQATYGGSSAR